MPPDQTDRQLILHVARRRGWEVSADGPNRVICKKGSRVISVNFFPDRPGEIISAFDGTTAVKGKVLQNIIAILNRGR